ncbi:MAG: glycosyltransferase family 4 protein [Armatimonadetes bacterium]|jgi:glycosyltransferase involved in cell wall biosynthesis|nr:glycosyltransferase family 4 protein [Armatimonadota bacterium]
MRLMQWNGARGWAGAEVRLVEACRRLRERGHYVVGVARAGAPLLQHLRAAGLPAFGTAAHGAADLPRIARAAWLARRQRVDLIHAHAGRDYVPAVLAARLANRPLVLHRHLAGPLRPLSRCFVRQAAAVIAVSNPVREALLRDDRIPAARVHRIPMLADLERTCCAPAAGQRVRAELTAGDRPLVVSVGHLHASKGHAELIRAVGLLRAAGQELVLAIAGEGRERETLARLIEANGLQGCVRLLGAREDVSALLAACDCFALLSWEDPFPGAVLEAMAAGKPVVACAAGGVPEMVRHEETGLLVAPRSPEAAAAALQRLLADAGLRQRLGEAAADQARREFHFDRMLEAWECLYADVLAAAQEGRRRGAAGVGTAGSER